MLCPHVMAFVLIRYWYPPLFDKVSNYCYDNYHHVIGLLAHV